VSRIIDLSQPLENGQPAFPSDPELRITPHAHIPSHGCAVSRISFSSHQGTHLDAPAHVIKGGKPVDAIPLERFHGPAELVDLAPGGALDPSMPITIGMLRKHAGAFRPGARILYRTGWDRRAGMGGYFEGFPSLTPETARWIVSRGVVLLGMDTPSPAENWKETHQVLLGEGAEVVVVEGLVNLHLLPQRFTFVGFPLNLIGLDGSPVRAVAVVEEPPAT
jgi:arylformamidase